MSSWRRFWLLRRLRKHAWLKPSELQMIQGKKLRKIIKYAYYNVAYYHRIFNSLNLRPRDIRSVDDLAKLPIITREEVRNNASELVSRAVDISKCKEHSTSGSTGKRVVVYTDQKAEDYRSAVFGRAFLECGLGLRQKMAFIGTTQTFPTSKRWYQRLGFVKRLHIDAREKPEDKINDLITYNPEGIYGYSSYIYLLAKAVKDSERGKLSPKLIIGTSEVLDVGTRKFIESVFDVRMLDFFGCIEMERTAWECLEQDGYHIDVDSVVMEFVKDGETVSSGERGEIIYTCLHNYAMPLIRYSVGDIGVPSDDSCPCGRGLPLMETIEGRSNDFISAPDGRIISPLAVANAVWSVKGWTQYQIIQESLQKFTIRLVKGDEFPNTGVSEIQRMMKEIIGSNIDVKVYFIDEIPRTTSGKYRTIMSNIKVDKALGSSFGE